MLCPRCQMANMDNATVCARCGTPLTAAYPPASKQSGSPAVVLVIIGAVAVGGLFVIAVLAAIMFPVFAKARQKAQMSTCMNNQRQVAVAIQIYAQDHNETLPSKDTIWSDISVSPEALTCPATEGTVGYGYNSYLSKTPFGNISRPDLIAVTADTGNSMQVLESDSDVDARHGHKYIASFVDGHVAACDASASIPLK